MARLLVGHAAGQLVAATLVVDVIVDATPAIVEVTVAPDVREKERAAVSGLTRNTAAGAGSARREASRR